MWWSSHPYDGPCYACWAAELRDENAVTANPGEMLDYGMIGPEGRWKRSRDCGCT